MQLIWMPKLLKSDCHHEAKPSNRPCTKTSLRQVVIGRKVWFGKKLFSVTVEFPVEYANGLPKRNWLPTLVMKTLPKLWSWESGKLLTWRTKSEIIPTCLVNSSVLQFFDLIIIEPGYLLCQGLEQYLVLTEDEEVQEEENLMSEMFSCRDSGSDSDSGSSTSDASAKKKKKKSKSGKSGKRTPDKKKKKKKNTKSKNKSKKGQKPEEKDPEKQKIEENEKLSRKAIYMIYNMLISCHHYF